jgi:hypothetical protein
MKKDIVKGMDAVYVPTKVGWSIYVWTGVPKHRTHDICFISAHGGTATKLDTTARDKLPPVQVFFYGPHGKNLQNPGPYWVSTGLQNHYEVCNATELPHDYDLSKSQGTHQSASGVNEAARNTGESYAYLGRDIHDYAGYMSKMYNGAPMPAELTRTFGREIKMDFVTIRNRSVLGGITLIEVIQKVWNAGFRYKQFHCIFCRGIDAKSTSHNPTGNLLPTLLA